ncbi:MAG: hypothetical protein ACP5HQ_06010 [Thermoprotei archaeon]
MTQGSRPDRVIRVVAYYRDPSILERVIAHVRKLFMDVSWVYSWRNGDVIEIYMGVPDHKNFNILVGNIHKTPEVEKVEVLEDARIVKFAVDRKGNVRQLTELNGAKEYDMVINAPVFSKVTEYSWGERRGKDLY